MEISLSSCAWEVKGYWPWVPIQGKSMEKGETLHGVTNWMEATVPGGVHYDLYRHGIIEDHPHFAKNSQKCEWVENRWWMYRTVFSAPAVPEGQRAELKLLGLDYGCFLYLNDKLIGEHEGMYEPKVIDVTALLKAENKLTVLFKSVPQEMGQIGYTSRTSTQKARFNYKWDFSTRMVNIGMWRDVVLHISDDAELENPYVYSTLRGAVGEVGFSARIMGEGEYGAEVTLFGPDGAAVCAQTRHGLHGGDLLDLRLPVNNPALWWPNGSGGQPLYTLRAGLQRGGTVSVFTWRVGIRSLSYAQNEGAGEAMPYTFVVNGRKLYIKGVNVTPMDLMYGNVSREQYRHMIAAMKKANVNLVRVWGGGIIETEAFYEECDRAGILVWQEFIQSSSGIDNKPCENPEFLELLRRNARAALLERRSHTCLAVWSGGNELMDAPDRPSKLTNPNLAMLKALVEEYDPQRMFLPTSASGPREFVNSERGMSHDVHGGWSYEGNPGHYEKYGESDSLFHSEFGTDGCCPVKSMKKFLPEKSLRPTPMSGDPNWQHHGEWWGTYNRDIGFFGPLDDLELFVQCGQFFQSEGLRYILEANRRRAFRNSGSIVWQMNEPYPNASCTNLMDYYGEAKPAYYTAAHAFRNLHVSMDYRRLDYRPGESFTAPVFAHNSEDGRAVKAEAFVREPSGRLLFHTDFKADMPANCAAELGTLAFTVPTSELFFVTLKITSGEARDENTYLFSTRDSTLFAPMKDWRPKVRLTELCCKITEDGAEKTFLLENTGDVAAVNLGLQAKEDDWWLLAGDGGLTLFPGEKTEVAALLLPRRCGGFLSALNSDGGNLPEVEAVYLGR